jgi:hypothetical protein
MRVLPVLLAHAVLLVVAAVFVVWDAGGPFGADSLVTAIVPILAVVVAGAVRAARGIAGARPLLLAADLGIAALAGATWLLSDPRFVEVPAWLFAATVAAAIVSAAVTLALPGGSRATVEREGRASVLPAAIAVLDVIAIGIYVRSLAGSEVTDLAPILATYISLVAAADGVAIVAWWWACRWPLGIGAISSAGVWLAATAQNPEAISAHPSEAAIAAISIALGLVAAAVGPVLRSTAREPGSSPAAPEAPPVALPPAASPVPAGAAPLSRPAAVWSVVGAILYPLLALFGVFPTVSDLCWSCVPAAPGQDLLIALTLASVVAVPVSTVILLLAARRPGGRWPAIVLLGTGVITLAELTLVSLGFTRFSYLFVAAAPAALVGLGGFLFLWPGLGRRAGAVCSLAAAALVIAWFAGSSAINTLGFAPGVALGSIPAGLLLPLAIAWEGDRATRLGEVATAQPTAEIPARTGTIGAPDPLDTPAEGP